MTCHQYNGNFNGPRKNISEPNLMGFDRSLKRFYDISMLSEENERKKSKMAQKIVNGPEKMSSILELCRDSISLLMKGRNQKLKLETWLRKYKTQTVMKFLKI